MEEVMYTIPSPATLDYLLVAVGCRNADLIAIGNRLVSPGEALLVDARGETGNEANGAVTLVFRVFEPGERNGSVVLDAYASVPFGPLLHPDQGG